MIQVNALWHQEAAILHLILLLLVEDVGALGRHETRAAHADPSVIVAGLMRPLAHLAQLFEPPADLSHWFTRCRLARLVVRVRRLVDIVSGATLLLFGHVFD